MWIPIAETRSEVGIRASVIAVAAAGFMLVYHPCRIGGQCRADAERADSARRDVPLDVTFTLPGIAGIVLTGRHGG